MTNIRALIVDDEANNRENLRLALAVHCPEVEVVGEADSAITAMDRIKAEQPDLVFLDIAMPLGSGFDLLEGLERIDFEIIFVTAYDKYAIRAIKFAAVDYLLKPINVLELKKAVTRVQSKHLRKHQQDQLATLLHNIKQQEKKIALPQADHIEFVAVHQIVRCRGDRNYTHFILKDGRKLLVSRTLKEYVELLEDQSFYRIHQSHLVNLNCIHKYSKRDGGILIMEDGEQLPVARARKEGLLERLLG
ncbi:MAG: LytTR family DNA-binding domain-containing protein [Bacteroidota bacterium]